MSLSETLGRYWKSLIYKSTKEDICYSVHHESKYYAHVIRNTKEAFIAKKSQVLDKEAEPKHGWENTIECLIMSLLALSFTHKKKGTQRRNTIPDTHSLRNCSKTATFR